MTTALFKSTHAALVYAYNYSGQQSPRTPMTTLMQRGIMGSGSGLTGLDGAAQAGFILSAVGRLNAHAQILIVARFGDVRTDCPCCGQPAPPKEWSEAVDALSHCKEMDGVPRAIRHACVERAVCSRKWDAAHLSRTSGWSERTIRDRAQALKKRLSKEFSAAFNELDQFFTASGMVGDVDTD